MRLLWCTFYFLSLFVLSARASDSHSKRNTKVYYLSVEYQTVNITGKKKRAMLVKRWTNSSHPQSKTKLPKRIVPASPCEGCVAGPVLYFKEGNRAIIHVSNKIDKATSLHWHGILLPNVQDGVPYLTTSPILPGKTHTYEFTLKQSGTYWYHSHTDLQEQRGVHGAIIVEPKRKRHWYHKDLALVLSDWTDEDPYEVLRTLKRGNEWYSFKKKTALSLSEVIRQGALWDQIKLWWQIMPAMDLSDVYYPAFLVNGQRQAQYYFKPGQKLRLRVINAAASTYFWLSIGGKKAPLLISADGIDVKPLRVKKLLHAIAETYDFLITIPRRQAIEFKAFAQDGTGLASAIIGPKKAIQKQNILRAPILPKPDLVQLMRDMANQHAAHQPPPKVSELHQGHQMQDKKKGKGHKGHQGHTMPSHSHAHHKMQDAKKACIKSRMFFPIKI